MKKLSILLAVFAVAITVLFASCNPTTGLEELTPSDITEKWVKGVWKGTIVIELNGDKTTDDITRDFSSGLSLTAGVVEFKTYAATGNFYADFGRTKVVYYDKYTDSNGDTIKATMTLRKQ